MTRTEIRSRALRAAVLVAGLTTAGASAGCDRLLARVLDGTGMDGTRCAGWSVRHGSPTSCCDDEGAVYDPASGQCLYPPVPGPFVPPADPREPPQLRGSWCSQVPKRMPSDASAQIPGMRA